MNENAELTLTTAELTAVRSAAAWVVGNGVTFSEVKDLTIETACSMFQDALIDEFWGDTGHVVTLQEAKEIREGVAIYDKLLGTRREQELSG
jgi:hypothetical protein